MVRILSSEGFEPFGSDRPASASVMLALILYCHAYLVDEGEEGGEVGNLSEKRLNGGGQRGRKKKNEIENYKNKNNELRKIKEN